MNLTLKRIKFVWSVAALFVVITFSWIYFIVQRDSTFHLQHVSQNRTPPIQHTFKNTLRHVGYVVSLGYGRAQQQGRCALGIISMQCWLKSFELPMHIVEPLVSSSKFLGLPNSKSQWINFGDIYDIDQFNKLTGVDGRFAQLVRWDDFLQNAPRNIIFVRMGSGTHHWIEVEWEMKLQHRDTSNSSFKPVPYLQDRGFGIVKVVNTVDGADNHPFTAVDLNKVIFNNWSPEDVTLVFSGWHPPYVVPNPKLKNPLLCQNFYAEGHQFFPPSKQLLQVVQKYINLFLRPSISVAVMIRSEHVLFSLGYLKQNKTLLHQTSTRVFNNLIATVRKLQANTRQGNIFVTADIGKYGSNTWHQMVRSWDRNLTSGVLEVIKRTVTTLYSNSWTFEEWEQSFGIASGGIEDQSYVAALQKAIAGRAQCLLLFGGGGFELVTLYEYLRNHPIPSKQCWKFLYTRRNFKGQYLELAAKYSGIKIDDVGVSAYLQHLLQE